MHADPERPMRHGIAPVWHTLVLTVVFVVLAIAGLVSAIPAASGQAVPSYIGALVFEWAMFFYIWWGLRLGKYPLPELIGRRRSASAGATRTILVALAFWVFWYGAETLAELGLIALGVRNASGHGTVFPHGAVQIPLWILLAASSGVCEEIAFRGYLLGQFSSWTGSPAWGVVLQAVLFGAAHSYLGARQVLLITLSGVLFGIFALWAKNLHPLMIAHGWADVFGGAIIHGLPYR